MTRPLAGELRQEGADPHLAPEVLDLLALARVNGDALDSTDQTQPSAEAAHLAACPRCADALDTRVAEIAASRESVDALVDETFTDAALDEQRRAILEQLAMRRDNGRVLAFPPRQPSAARRDRPAFRWLAAAAAAGLFVGMLAGQRIHPLVGSTLFGPGHETAARFGNRVQAWTPEPVATTDPRLVSTHDELFLSEMETTLNNRGALQLRALDDLTPKAVPASARDRR